MDKIYYELALLINKELYDANIIPPSLYKITEQNIFKELSK